MSFHSTLSFMVSLKELNVFQEFSHLTTNFGNFAADLVKGVCGLIFPLFRELRRNFFFCIIPLTFPLFFANVFSSSSSAVFQYFESLIFLLIVQVKRASLFVELVHLLLMHLILLLYLMFQFLLRLL